MSQTTVVALTVGPLLVAALVTTMAAFRAHRTIADVISLVTAVAALGPALWLLVRVGEGRVVVWSGGWDPAQSRPVGHPVGVALVADRAALTLVALTALLTVAAMVYSWRFLEDTGTAYHALLMVFLGSVSGFALAGDLFNAFVWFELMGVAAYALTGMRVEEPRSLHGAMNFGIVNTVGGSLLLVGVTLLYARTGELNLAAVGESLRSRPADALVSVACALLFSGVLVKAAAVPFHFWTADAEAVAPTPVCVLLSGAMVTVGAYAVARWWWVVFVDVLPEGAVRHTLLGIGAVTAVLGGVMCAGQRHVKRLLAYSTVAHIGVVVRGVGLLDSHGLAAAGIYAIGHACVKGALFLGTGVLLNRYRSVDEYALYGRARGRWSTAAVFVVGGLGLCGVPPFGSWLGKAELDHAATTGHHAWLVPVLLVPAVLTGGAVLRVAGRVFLGLGDPPPEEDQERAAEEPEAESGRSGARASMLAPAAVLLALGLAPGLVPGLPAAAETAAETMADPVGYVSAVLGTATGAGRPAPALVPDSSWTLQGVGLAALAGVLAVGFAALSLWHRRLPRWLQQPGRAAAAVLDGLHRVHRAHVGDYVSWTLVGVAALGAMLLLS